MYCGDAASGGKYLTHEPLLDSIEESDVLLLDRLTGEEGRLIALCWFKPYKPNPLVILRGGAGVANAAAQICKVLKFHLHLLILFVYHDNSLLFRWRL